MISILIIAFIAIARSFKDNNIGKKNEYKLKTLIHIDDIQRAHQNSLKHNWANKITKSILSQARYYTKLFTNSYIKNMISEITPGSETLCPHCVKKGLSWHSNGYWSWSNKNPDQITCKVCGLTFPHKDYPETIIRISNWNSSQKISYVDMKEQKCMNYYGCKSSMSGVIRRNKLHFIINSLEKIGIAYQLTKDIIFAETIKKVFNRLASVIPSYLVYEGYSYAEYADCEPKYVALNINNLQKDKTKKCRLLKATGINNNPIELYSGYWSASRLGTAGMDGVYVSEIAIAYDLIKETCTEKEIKYYEKNILEEIILLGIGDNTINNKSVFNIKGIALVGLITENLKYIKFGLNGFLNLINNWYLKDGGTPETAKYGMMGLTGVFELGFAFRNYSDPINYTPHLGEKKYINFNCITDTNYYQIFQSLIWTSYGNFYYPSIGDSYNYTILEDQFIEYLNYINPIEKKYINEKLYYNNTSLLGLFFRDPEKDNFSKKIKFTHPDIVFPFLSQGYIRTGKYGEKSLIVLDASRHGNHHHLDSLNLVFWKEGYELLSDLGYLWDHKDRREIYHTYSHNTVVVNEKDQIERNTTYGSFSIFFNSSKVKVMQAASNAYDECDVYNRTIIQIEHKDKSSYFVDIFRVHGGINRQYVFHVQIIYSK